MEKEVARKDTKKEILTPRGEKSADWALCVPLPGVIPPAPVNTPPPQTTNYRPDSPLSDTSVVFVTTTSIVTLPASSSGPPPPGLVPDEPISP